MLTVVAVLAILMGLAAPGMNGLLDSQRLRSTTFDLIADLTLARSESLKRGLDVAVTPISGRDWSAGWQVRTDELGELLRERSPAGGTLVFTGAPTSVVFDRNGRLARASNILRIQLDSSALTGPSGTRCISIDMLGRARSNTGDCGS
jgi:type IV fimbrial biogenesis protein FimT